MPMNFLAFISRAGFVCGEEKVDRGGSGVYIGRRVLLPGADTKLAQLRDRRLSLAASGFPFSLSMQRCPIPPPCLFKWRPPSATTHSGVAVRAMRQARSVGGGSGVESIGGDSFLKRT